MLNENGERELAYVAKIEEICPIPNYDRVEYARIGAGWWCIVRKSQFKPGDYCIYFEVDSKTPEVEPFMFLEKRRFRVKTLKMCGVVSQGLIMSFSDFVDAKGMFPVWLAEIKLLISQGVDITGKFLTKSIGVTYAEDEDNKRKAPSFDKYKIMAQRQGKLFSHFPFRQMMRHSWGKKILFVFFGKKKDKKNGWPAWVQKSDEERVENMPWLFPDNPTKWIPTEKIDGSSSTFTMKNTKKKNLIVCSRNVVFDTPDKPCFYDTNVYLEMAEKYNMKQACINALASVDKLDFITFQGEVYGGKIQKRDYGPEHRLAIFNIILGFKNGEVKRLNPLEMGGFLASVQPEGGLPLEHVPVLANEYYLPATCEEVKAITGGESKIDGGMREGIVFRSEDGKQSFKSVDPEFLLKYHY